MQLIVTTIVNQTELNFLYLYWITLAIRSSWTAFRTLSSEGLSLLGSVIRPENRNTWRTPAVFCELNWKHLLHMTEVNFQERQLLRTEIVPGRSGENHLNQTLTSTP